MSGVQNMEIEKKNKDDSDIATAIVLAKRLDKINKITAITGLTLLGVVLTSYVVQIFNSAFPMHYLWYALGFCFIAWFATRKDGCGSCNQRGCV
jgi:hypothetical protein